MLGGLKFPFFLQKVNLRGAVNNLDYLKVVHVLILRPHSSIKRSIKNRQTLARPFDHWLPDEERPQELVLSRCRLMNVNGVGTHANSSNGTDLFFQRIKLIGKIQLGAASFKHGLPLGHVHGIRCRSGHFWQLE
jgi:hypothetical protein